MLKDVMVCSIRCSLWRCLAIRSTAAPTAVDRSTAVYSTVALSHATVCCRPSTAGLQSTVYSGLQVYRSTPPL